MKSFFQSIIKHKDRNFLTINNFLYLKMQNKYLNQNKIDQRLLND